MERIHSLDWLRRIMAIAIMFYHCALFTDIAWVVDSSTSLGRLGIYGVSIFFVLSGLSMAHVYLHKMDSIGAVARFLARRAFRIWPLLAFVVALAAVLSYAEGEPYSAWRLIINVTGSFSLIDPDAYINTGAWSIGNEIVFYLLTPPLFWLYSLHLRAGDTAVVLTILLGFYFAFVFLTPDSDLAVQWPIYVNPLNNLFLYTVGVALFVHFQDFKPSHLVRLLLLAGPIATFALYPVYGDHTNITTGWNRIAFSIFSIMIVLSFYKSEIRLPTALATPLSELGTISYGVYLLHPFAISAVRRLPGDLQQYSLVFILLVSLTTIGAAAIIYRLLERPLVQYGKYVTRKKARAHTCGTAP